jgi:MscS family membrane protein
MPTLPLDIDYSAVSTLSKFFWTWVYPVLAVATAGLASAWSGGWVPDKDADNDGRPDLLSLMLRGLVQAAVFGFSLAGFIWADRAIHGEPAYLPLLAKTTLLVLGLWTGFRVVETAARVLRGRFKDQGRTAAAAVVPLLQKVAKVGLVLIGTVLYLDNLGVNVSALLAGLGVGGLAVALAGQRTIENLFGGIMLILDQPVRVGDFCRFGDKVGTVEDIGLRSTRIRTLDRTVVSIPNGSFSQMELENFAKRDKIWLQAELRLRYETSAAQLEALIQSIRAMLLADERVDPEPARVRFVRFGAYSLDLEIFAYIKVTDINDFLAVREELYLKIMGLVEAAGTGFAIPSQTLYMGQDKGLPPIAT